MQYLDVIFFLILYIKFSFRLAPRMTRLSMLGSACFPFQRPNDLILQHIFFISSTVVAHLPWHI